MSKIADLRKSIPDSENTFSVDIEGILTKNQYSGEFSCRIPNMKLQANIEKYRAGLNGGLSGLPLSILNLHTMISYLRFTLIDSPKWWKESDMGYELYDNNVIQGVYDKVLEFEKDWYESIWGKEVPSEDSGEQSKQG